MIDHRRRVLFASLVIAALAPISASAGKNSPKMNYWLHCVGCHLDDGMGSTVGQIPPIPGIAGHFLKHEKGRLFLVNVPGVVNASLPDDDTANVLNYILSTWGTKELPEDWKPFTAEEVGELRKVKIDDITELRKGIAADLMAKFGINISY